MTISVVKMKVLLRMLFVSDDTFVLINVPFKKWKKNISKFVW